ncbi:hypothetical protein RRG08_024474 [Elysia crispata]|uniref:Uncharacterized protein n=1 Tax=Elysia crispata TaxID=231223 RepID=A0AAE0YP55_9GAST|nr:hypothetical protein RRG08_024474 [Elysia crispata]
MLLTTSEDAPKTNKPVESWKLVSATDSTVVTESGDLGKGWGLKRSSNHMRIRRHWFTLAAESSGLERDTETLDLVLLCVRGFQIPFHHPQVTSNPAKNLNAFEWSNFHAETDIIKVGVPRGQHEGKQKIWVKGELNLLKSANHISSDERHSNCAPNKVIWDRKGYRYFRSQRLCPLWFYSPMVRPFTGRALCREAGHRSSGHCDSICPSFCGSRGSLGAGLTATDGGPSGSEKGIVGTEALTTDLNAALETGRRESAIHRRHVWRVSDSGVFWARPKAFPPPWDVWPDRLCRYEVPRLRSLSKLLLEYPETSKMRSRDLGKKMNFQAEARPSWVAV